MAGAPQPNQPYGHQLPPMPQYAPVAAKRPGSTSTKVWGILLLILGLMGIMMLLVNIASMGGGMSASSFSNVSPAAKAEIDAMTQALVEDSLSRWSFWLYNAIEIIISVLSVGAGIFLAFKPKPLGRNLAIVRVVMCFVLIPIYAYETSESMEGITDMQNRMMKISIDDNLAQQEKHNPSKDQAEKDRRRKNVEEAMGIMQPFMKGAIYGGLVITIVGILVLNSLLLFFMTRPAVKEYLESIAAHGDNAIPGYDPSMGLASGPPPQQPPPQ